MLATLTDKFILENNRKQLFQPDNLIMVAISGGIDSVVLSHLLLSIRQPIVLAHCNFSLRGAESDRDEAFVKKLAGEWQVPLHVKKFDTYAYASEHQLSIQLAARQLRYDFFEELRLQLSRDGKQVLIATAHHANDSVETLLMNLFRGTGIDGLRGIPEKNRYIIRPMLFAQRHDIESYAKQHQLDWVEDSSNEKENYTRNYIRHTVLPSIGSQYPSVIENINRTIDRLKDVSGLYHEAVNRRLNKWVLPDGKGQKIPVLRLMKSEYVHALIWEWIKDYGFTDRQVDEVMKLFHASNGSYIASASHRIIRNRAWLLMMPVEETQSTFFIVENLPASIILPDGKSLTIYAPVPYESTKGIPSGPSNEAWLDGDGLPLPFMVRPWKQGDYFYPLGMAKKKKVARFLIDQKVSPVEKQHVWVMESSNRICWVIGHRMDDRFKLGPKTKKVIRMKVQ